MTESVQKRTASPKPRRGEPKTLTMRQDIAKNWLPKQKKTNKSLLQVRKSASLFQYALACKQLVSKKVNDILNKNWKNIITTINDKNKDAKLRALKLSPEELLQKRKTSHRGAIQKWWITNRSKYIS